MAEDTTSKEQELRELVQQQTEETEVETMAKTMVDVRH